jgi:amino acid adenylation domain-containing protein/non-ribosomal peptide synthase protein (TIGR01720 family)
MWIVNKSTERNYLRTIQKASEKIKRLSAEVGALKVKEPVAVIGMGCRFPGGGLDPDSFWRLLEEGGDAVGCVPPERWSVEAYYDPHGKTPGTAYTMNGGFLDAVDGFDCGFFGISAGEAAALDPQQRLLLEVSWETLEHAGIDPARLKGTRTGVFLGMCGSDYHQAHLGSGDPERIDEHSVTGVALSTAAGRLSYFYDFHGPSVVMDSACSSSLLALHHAVRSLREGETEIALAGGVHLILTPEPYIGFSRLGALSPSGKCRAFDASADGYVRGEGCGLVLLKRLSDARRDGDKILALIRGSAVNQDGQSNGLTAPNALAQKDVIERALADAGLAPGAVDYVEAHGTGTSLGDPIEARALAMVFGKRRPLPVGSVKTNIGHLEAAAGMASLIKVILSMGRGRIPASLHFENPNPHIPWEEIPLSVVTENTPWPRGPGERVAGISAFGFSGTNVHMVVSGPPEEPARTPDRTSDRTLDQKLEKIPERPLHILTLSAREDLALAKIARSYADLLLRDDGVSPADVCHSANTGRHRFSHCTFVVGDTRETLGHSLLKLSEKPPSLPEALERERGACPEVVFLYPGHDRWNAGMGEQLYTAHPVFRDAVDRCGGTLAKLGIPLVELLYGRERSCPDRMDLVPPILAAFACALTELWISWGVKPAAVLMHGTCGFAAAWAAGVLPLEESLRLAVERGKTLAAVTGGEAKPKALEEFRETVCRASFAEPEIPVFSAAAGRRLTAMEAGSPAPWCRGEPETDRFREAVSALREDGYTLFLEIGPDGVLASREAPGGEVWLSSLIRGEGEWRRLLTSLGELSVAGVEIDWRAFDRPFGERKRVALPSYPFRRTPHWRNPVIPREAVGKSPPGTGGRGRANPPDSRKASAGTGREAGKEAGKENSMARMRGGQRPLVLAKLRGIAGEILGGGAGQLDPGENLFRIGFTSIMLTSLRQRIENDFGVEIDMSSFYDRTDTLHLLADHLDTHMDPGLFAGEDPGTPRDASDMECPNFPRGPAELMNGHIPQMPAELVNGQAGPGLTEFLNGQIRAMGDLMTRQLELLKSAGASSAADFRPERASIAPVETDRRLPGKPPGSRAREQVDLRSMKLSEDSLTPRQQEFVARFTERYCRRTAGSKALMQDSRKVFSDWISSLGFRLSLKEIIYPIVARTSEGAAIRDVDGNEYIDLAIGYGVNYFGNRAPFVVEAVEKQLREGFHLGPQLDVTCEVAQRISAMTGVERVTFCNTGTEAVMTALRMARTATGREKIVLFENSYHGTFDGALAKAGEGGSLPASPGTPEGMVAEVEVLPYGQAESLERIRALGNRLAAVLVEPVQSRNPSLVPGEFLRTLRKITEEARCAMIFDEVITGFRICPGGAQAYFGIRADLVIYGKVIGGGMPVGIIAGKSRFMDVIDGGDWTYGDGSFPRKGVTFFGGTFCKHPLAMASALAVLKHLESEGPGLQQAVNDRTARLAEALNAFFESEKVSVRVRHFASYFRFESFGEFDPALQAVTMDLFFFLLMEKGVYTWERRICFLSTAHTDAHVERVIESVKQSVAELRRGGFPFGREASEKPSRNVYPATAAQLRLCFLSRFPGGEAAYHMTAAASIEGPLETERLKSAFAELVRRHDALRTGLEMGEEGIVQRVRESVDFSVTHTRIEEDKRERFIRDQVRPFDLSEPPLARVALGTLGGHRHLLVMDAHHAVVDGISLNILMEELVALYGGASLPDPRLSGAKGAYGEYALREREFQASDAMIRQGAYWEKRLAGELPVLELPADFPRGPKLDFAGGTLVRSIPPGLTRRLRSVARQNNATLQMLLLAAFDVLMYRLTGQRDILVGTPVDTRPAAFARTVGMFTNTLAMRFPVEESLPFTSFLSEVKRGCLSAYDHREYPFEQLVKRLGLQGETTRNPLFEVVFVHEIGDSRCVDTGEVRFSQCDVDNGTAIFDFTAEFIEEGEEIRLNLRYRTSLFERGTIERWAGYIERILSAVADDPERPVRDIDPLSDAEREILLNGFNPPPTDYPAGETVLSLFEAQVNRTPAHPAVVCGERTLDYRELNAMANGLACALTERFGVARGDAVAVLARPSERLVAGLLAIARAGAAYVPIDPGTPEERLGFILTDCGAAVLLTETEFLERVRNFRLSRLCLDREIPEPSPGNASAISSEGASTLSSGPGSSAPGPEDALYVIYTSGTTGKPKGCVITHRNVVRLMKNGAFPFDFNDRDVWVAAHSFCFDFSVWEMYGALLYGGKLVIARPEEVRNPQAFLELIRRHRVTVLNQTPGAFYQLAAAEQGQAHHELDRHLRYVIFGGDRLEPAYLKPWVRLYPLETVRMVNMYGITETTVHVTHYLLTSADVFDGRGKSPVGRPLPETRVYVCDEFMRPCPIGIPGELYIGGTGVCRGYLNRPELTARRFLDSPFRQEERLYRTGDLGRWQQDGTLEFLGRNDDQVQIRGYRVELGEIQARLLAYGPVKDALIVARDSGGGVQELVAYLTAGEALAVGPLREHLKKTLPGYMIPSFFVQMEKIPLTVNGKVDKKSLTGGTPLATGIRREPETPVEKTLCDIWRGVLGIENVGAADDFFALGGDSIKAIQIVARMRAAGLLIEMDDLFRHPVIAELAGRVKKPAGVISRGPVTGSVPLTAVQRWMFSAGGPSHHFTQAVWISAGKVAFSETAVSEVLGKIQEHHDALRMRYRIRGETILQENTGPECPVRIETADLRGEKDPEGRFREFGSRAAAGIDLAEAPMMRAVLFRMDAGDRLLLVIHHLVVDGVSWRILIDDLRAAFALRASGEPIRLPERSASFKVWAERIAEYAKSPDLLAEMVYWEGVGKQGTIPLPLTPPSGPMVEEDFVHHRCSLNCEETRAVLDRTVGSDRVEINVLLLTALARAMKAWHGSERTRITLEGHGREALFPDLNVSRTVGWFTSLFPVVLDLTGRSGPPEQLRAVREALGAVPNRGVGYGILRHLTPPELTGGAAFREEPMILFNYLGGFGSDAEGDLFEVREFAENTVSPRFRRFHPLVFEGMVTEGELRLSLSRNRHVLAGESAEKLLSSFREEIRLLSRHLSRTPGERPAASAAPEKEKSPLSAAGDDGPGPEEKEVRAALSECGLSREDVESVFPLSPMQEGMLFHELLEPDSSAYFEQFSFPLTGELDPGLLEEALSRLPALHDTLRAVFAHDLPQEPLQVVLKRGRIPLRFEDLRPMDGKAREQHLADFRERDRKEGFNLGRGPLMRFALFRTAENAWEAVWSHHHIVLDGWSNGIIVRELLSAYAALRKNRIPELSPSPSYSRYVRWLAEARQGESLDFWKDYLDGCEAASGLPRAMSGQPEAYQGAAGSISLTPAASAGIASLAAKARATMSTATQCLWAVLLGGYTAADDVVFGAVVSGRPVHLDGVEKMVGLFLNTVPVRVSARADQAFSDLVAAVQKRGLEAAAHHHVPFVDIRQACGRNGDLVDHVVIFENYPLSSEMERLAGELATGFQTGPVTGFERPGFDLALEVYPGERIRFFLKYNELVYDGEEMLRVLAALSKLSEAVSRRPEITVAELRNLTAPPRRDAERLAEAVMELDEDF